MIKLANGTWVTEREYRNRLDQVPYDHQIAAINAHYDERVARILLNVHIEITLQQIEHACEHGFPPRCYLPPKKEEQRNNG